MEQRDLARQRAAALREFEAWAREQREPDAAATLVLAGGLYELLDPAQRERAIDPSGVQAMHRALRVLG
jgi:hypothetical protein